MSRRPAPKPDGRHRVSPGSAGALPGVLRQDPPVGRRRVALLGAALEAVPEGAGALEPAAVRPGVGPGSAGDVAGDEDGERRLVEVAGLQVTALGNPARPGTGEAVRLQLAEDAGTLLPSESHLHGVAELVGQHERRREVPALDVVRDHQAALVPGDEVARGAVEGVVRGCRLAAALGAAALVGAVVGVAPERPVAAAELRQGRPPVLLQESEGGRERPPVGGVVERGAAVRADGAGRRGLAGRVPRLPPVALPGSLDGSGDDLAERGLLALVLRRAGRCWREERGGEREREQASTSPWGSTTSGVARRGHGTILTQRPAGATWKRTRCTGLRGRAAWGHDPERLGRDRSHSRRRSGERGAWQEARRPPAQRGGGERLVRGRC